MSNRFTASRSHQSLRAKTEVDFPPALTLTHGICEFRARRQLLCIEFGDRRDKAAAAIEEFVGKRDHLEVWSRLGSDPHEPLNNGVLTFARRGLRKDHRHRRSRT